MNTLLVSIKYTHKQTPIGTQSRAAHLLITHHTSHVDVLLCIYAHVALVTIINTQIMTEMCQYSTDQSIT